MPIQDDEIRRRIVNQFGSMEKLYAHINNEMNLERKYRGARGEDGATILARVIGTAACQLIGDGVSWGEAKGFIHYNNPAVAGRNEQ